MDDSHGSPLIWLDPRSIRDCFRADNLWAKLRSVPDRTGMPDRIRRGGWDRRVSPFEEHPTFRLMKALEECDYDVGRLQNALGESFPRRRGRRPRELKAPDFVHYVERYRKIAVSMRRDGYLPAAADAHMRVAIARDGRPVKISGGNHRLAIARLVKLSAVHAEVRFVHSKWCKAAASPDPGEIPGYLEKAGFAVGKDHDRSLGLQDAMPRV